MNYIVHRRFKYKAICGEINLPAMSECEEVKGVIYYQNKPVCVATSHNAHQFFARNDDGEGMRRGRLTQAIHKALQSRLDPRTDEKYKRRWDKVWNDHLCRTYKRKEIEDHWLWNHEFYNAPIADLEYIAELVGA